MTAARLNIGTPAAPFYLPAAELVTQTLVVYGGKGMGKTNLIAVVCEELAAAGRRFALLDPVGVSWGLRHAAAGKGAGIDVLILGGIHGDLPIEPTAGNLVADFVADEEQNVIIDVSRRADGQMWGAGEKIRFVTDYMLRLYQRQGERRRPVLQIVDEAGRFVPQNPLKGALDIASCIGAIEQLVELGRNVGVGVMLVTQRSARMAKSVSELAECMVAFRTVGPRSVDAILDWFGEHMEKSRRPALLEQLRQLPRGRALVVSPGWLEFEDAVTFRARTTFDSSATPTAAERRMVKQAPSPERLDAFKARLAETVEKAKREDPRELRKQLDAVEKVAAKASARITALEGDLQAARAKPVKPGPPAPRPWSAKDIAAIDRLASRYAGVADRLEQQLLFNGLALVEGAKLIQQAIDTLVAKLKTSTVVPNGGAFAVPAAMPAAAAAAARERGEIVRHVRAAAARPVAVADGELTKLADGKGRLKKHVRSLLTVLAQHGTKRFNRGAWHRLAGYAPSGDTSTAIAELLERGMVVDHCGFTITPHGLEILGTFDELPTGPELRRHLLQKSTTVERKLLEVWFNNYPVGMSRGEAFELAGYKPSGDTSTAVAKFLTLGWLVETEKGRLTASEDFFA